MTDNLSQGNVTPLQTFTQQLTGGLEEGEHNAPGEASALATLAAIARDVDTLSRRLDRVDTALAARSEEDALRARKISDSATFVANRADTLLAALEGVRQINVPEANGDVSICYCLSGSAVSALKELCIALHGKADCDRSAPRDAVITARPISMTGVGRGM